MTSATAREKLQQKRSRSTNTNGGARSVRRSRGAKPPRQGLKKNFCRESRLALLALLVMLMCGGAASCAKRTTAAMRAVKPGYREEGVASWYGEPYHGRKTASGEVYDMNQLTAAHRRLPFDTVARIVHRGNGRSVEVRINDRGPFVDGRFLDLSRAAAANLGMQQDGTARVKLRVVRAPNAHFGVQAAAFSTRAAAEEFHRRYRGRLPDSRVIADGSGFRVVAGNGSRSEAERLRGELERAGIKGAFVIPLSK